MNETINEANIYNNADVSANWARLLRHVHESNNSFLHVYLTDDKADKYNFSDAVLMQVMRTRLVEALRAKWTYLDNMDLMWCSGTGSLKQ